MKSLAKFWHRLSRSQGFLENVYERALLQGLQDRGLDVKGQEGLTVAYKGRVVGEYLADLIVEEQVIVELKCVAGFAPEHMAQCLNYLKASNLKVALLLNFRRTKLEWKRIVNNF
jgi:GxxExxY protein